MRWAIRLTQLHLGQRHACVGEFEVNSRGWLSDHDPKSQASDLQGEMTEFFGPGHSELGENGQQSAEGLFREILNDSEISHPNMHIDVSTL